MAKFDNLIQRIRTGYGKFRTFWGSICYFSWMHSSTFWLLLQFFEMSHSIGSSGMLLMLYQPFLSQICCRSFSGACSCGRCVWGVVGTAGSKRMLARGLIFLHAYKNCFLCRSHMRHRLFGVNWSERRSWRAAEAHWKNGMCQDDKRNSI